MRITTLAKAAVLVLSPVLISAQTLTKTSAAPARDIVKMINVHEGTDMAVTVSPDRSTLLIDLQGMIYSLPTGGGKATRITGPIVEASHPVYSPKGDLVAIQSYQGGTFHLWTMKPDGTGLKQVTSGHGDDREPYGRRMARVLPSLRTAHLQGHSISGR